MTAAPIDEQHSQHLRQRLVERLKAQWILSALQVSAALLTVPRELFVPACFIPEHTPDETTKRTTTTNETATHEIHAPIWSRINAQAPQYLTQLYQDEPLVTHLDAQQQPVRQSCSFTTRVHLLETLNVHKWHNTLVIGMETGYTAALVASQSKWCTAIDQDAEVIQHVGAQLDQAKPQFAFPNLMPVQNDVLQGYEARAPYDRILVTASTPTLPLAWITQLAPGGRLICELRGPLAGGFLVLGKNRHSEVHGIFLPFPLTLMPLRTGQVTEPVFPELATFPFHTTLTNEVAPIVSALVGNPAFGWFVQWALPGLHVQRQSTPPPVSPQRSPYAAQPEVMLRVLAPDRRSVVVCTPCTSRQQRWRWQVEIAAQNEQQTLWTALLNCYARWHRLQHHAIDGYSLRMIQENRRVLCVDEEMLELP